ncbi:hypothetical protein RJ639_009129 [Escallonia herrerae]|uniref:Longin domain-containing protein n=1 Tax=Escallonia herrerae TaxID=1293975 RepID=A0AA88VVE5_9ASTE|nr:hypothetical protein RJ639_009129 [Escallonia herrerae]
MGSIQDTVYYCCVSKNSRILYVFSNGEPEIENLAALCLERAPPYHKWYFHTMNKKTFGFFMESGYVYFAIADKGLGKPGVLQFIERVKEEFKKVAKKGSSRSMSNLDSVCLQEQLVPVIRHLIASLEHVSESGTQWPAGVPSRHGVEFSLSPCDEAIGQIEAGVSTKAPLLGKPSKSSRHEKKKMKDHLIAVRDIELEEHRKSADRGVKVDSGTLDSNNQGAPVSSISLQKDLRSMRTRSSTQNLRKKCCRQVRIVLAIDAAVCLVLLVIWLVICSGIECIR